jgi:hypothetical protein
MLHEHIYQAIEELENRSISPSIVDKQYKDFDILIDLIADESSIEPHDIGITEAAYRDRIEGIITEISDSEKPVASFHTELDNLEDEIEDSHQEYTVLFPWNFTSTNVSGLDTPIQIRNLTIHRTSESRWNRYQQKAIDIGTFDQFLEELPTRRNHSKPFSYQKYWEVTLKAESPEFAVNRVSNAMEILLGKITFATYFGRVANANRRTNWKYGMTDLRHPLCHLVTQNDEFVHYYTAYDFTPRRRFTLSGSKKRDFNKIYPMIPIFDGEMDDIEEHLITAFGAYYSAMSEPKPSQSLLDYWRCLEVATLTQDENHSAGDPLKRARAAKRPQDIGISDNLIERLVQKRNRLVHKGGEIMITDGDLTHLKSLSEASIWFLMTDKSNYSYEEFEFFFEYGSKPANSILQAKTDRESRIREKNEEIEDRKEEIKQLNQIIEWLKLDED